MLTIPALPSVTGSLYRDQSLPPTVHVAVSPDLWSSLRSSLSNDLRLLRDIGLASCPKGCTLVSVANRKISGLSEVPIAFPGERRVWISVRMPPGSDRKLSAESQEVLCMWASCISNDCPIFPLALALLLSWEPFVDACAGALHAGIGGFVRLQAQLSRRELSDLFKWFPAESSPQKLVAAWELLGQLALVWCVALLIPAAHPPAHFVSRCDNSPSDSASWKGLFTARGLCDLLRTYFSCQRHLALSIHIDHDYRSEFRPANPDLTATVDGHPKRITGPNSDRLIRT
ncbi:hypothetical protein AK812_SmicGene19439 [Symbiodinium microadriaticum]|uniref:Uncharacterized protein n=1 Tax=Symbiodinium microadriaticum TaxID=2951 RepID=A0A1Q9DSL5_SYMMI|nr:hypothetical protein AK812_SmicGene19439 [Symbiodinium microadriaticum]CAE7515782.1 unnamed protein product [Symbiodinium sp. KB8]